MSRIAYSNPLNDIPASIRAEAIKQIKASKHRVTVERVTRIALEIFEREQAANPEKYPTKKICPDCGAGEDPDDDFECCCAEPDYAPKGFRSWN